MIRTIRSILKSPAPPERTKVPNYIYSRTWFMIGIRALDVGLKMIKIGQNIQRSAMIGDTEPGDCYKIINQGKRLEMIGYYCLGRARRAIYIS